MNLGAPSTPFSELPAIASWLEAFSSAVRERDFEKARPMFDERVLGFGTVCNRAEDLEVLMREQQLEKSWDMR